MEMGTEEGGEAPTLATVMGMTEHRCLQASVCIVNAGMY